MRLWSLHPVLLDRQGLVALWREGLLARKVLAGLTKGYRHHPQLERFRERAEMFDDYLFYVLHESRLRGYKFDASKIDGGPAIGVIDVTRDQLDFEHEHLLRKVEARSPDWFVAPPAASPFFNVVDGPVAGWERTSGRSPM